MPLNRLVRSLVFLAVLGVVSFVQPTEAEAQCSYICDSCVEQYQGCGAGCWLCNWGYGPTCNCGEYYTGDPCCRQCIGYGSCYTRMPIPFDAKRELHLALLEMTRAELREPSAGADRSDGGNAEHPSSVDAPRIR